LDEQRNIRVGILPEREESAFLKLGAVVLEVVEGKSE
jgi:hypothetical protein